MFNNLILSLSARFSFKNYILFLSVHANSLNFVPPFLLSLPYINNKKAGTTAYSSDDSLENL